MAELRTMLKGLSPSQRRVMALAIIAGGVVGGQRVKSMVKKAQREQKELVSDVEKAKAAGSGFGVGRKATAKIAVNKQFFDRLFAIMRICVPSIFSKEALLIALQGGLLVSRTLLTDIISRVEGYSGSTLVSKEFEKFGNWLVMFAALGVPAAIVNSGLKYMQKQIELAFQMRLTKHLHLKYCSNRAYYAASTLGGLTNADQRLTEDVEKFCYAISELYSHTVKPLLDVVLFTWTLSRTMGYRNQFLLYIYYIASAYLLRSISPPLAQMTAQEAALSGAFRAAHQRLVTNSEEVAFNDPPAGAAEELILNQHLRRLVRYSGLSALQRFIQQIADGYFIKYFASVIALLVYALPIYFGGATNASQADLTRDYIRSMRLLQNTSRGVGDLILVYKRISTLASHTSRVAELAEQVAVLSNEDAEHRELFRRNVSSTHVQAINPEGKRNADGTYDQQLASPPPEPARHTGTTIKFHRVALDSPDGTPLIRELSCEVLPNRSMMLMGPNGCGKSSLFRVLAGLWPLQGGEITTPVKSKLFYLSQRPYLVSGSLRDQLLYPNPPRAVWRGAHVRERAHFLAEAGAAPPAASKEIDADLEACLVAVELEHLLQRAPAGWDQVQQWQETLSGGEKQRLAMARLLFHRPQYAILDECTSAVSADGELRLYQECQKAGITFLSIAHRPTLKRFHSAVIHFDGNVSNTGKGWWLEELPPPSSDLAPISMVRSVNPAATAARNAPLANGGSSSSSAQENGSSVYYS